MSTDELLEIELDSIDREEAEELAIIATEDGTWSDRYRQCQDRFEHRRYQARKEAAENRQWDDNPA